MKIYITNYAVYKPSPENPAEMPKLEYVDALFRRRLSQITRMTIEAVHALSGDDDGVSQLSQMKLCFASFRGEIARQLKINKGLVEDADVMPAPFSLSVFNTPPAAATIALGMKAGYTAVYPAEDDFKGAFLSAASAVLCGSEKNVVFAFADEKIPDEYRDCRGFTDALPLAFACIISAEPSAGSAELELDGNLSEITASPQKFLDFLEGSVRQAGKTVA